MFLVVLQCSLVLSFLNTKFVWSIVCGLWNTTSASKFFLRNLNFVFVSLFLIFDSNFLVYHSSVNGCLTYTMVVDFKNITLRWLFNFVIMLLTFCYDQFTKRFSFEPKFNITTWDVLVSIAIIKLNRSKVF